MDWLTGRTAVAAPRASTRGRAGGLALVSIVLGVCAAQAAEARPVRVRVVAGDSRVEIVDAEGTRRVVRARAEGLEIDAGHQAGRLDLSSSHAPYRVRSAAGGAVEVRGGLVVRPGEAGMGVDVINIVSLEDYVAGTLGGEMVASWAPAALRAQAVACRTYVLYQIERRREESYDVAADVTSQRYLGVRGESDAAWAAVRSTSGEILRFEGAPALAAFHSASGGQTASAGEVWGAAIPYLRSVAVENEDDSPDTYWRATVSEGSLSRGLAELGYQIGRLEELEVSRRSLSGRAGEVSFRGSQGRAKVTGRQLRQVLGSTTIKSTLFEVRRMTGEVVFVGSGSGHGVGMSQWAAQAMALEGAAYAEILGKFYPGTSLGPRIDTDRKPRLAGLPAVSMPKRPRPSRSHERMGERKR